MWPALNWIGCMRKKFNFSETLNFWVDYDKTSDWH